MQMTPELADAWEKFSNMIIQEFIYDTWWGALSPDTHFPALVRDLLNNAAACLVTRGKDVNLNYATIHIVHSLAVRPLLVSPLCGENRSSYIANSTASAETAFPLLAHPFPCLCFVLKGLI
jgi:hypothetical protein